jgi:hypothetical protein
MKLEINAMVRGRPAHAVIELPEVKWLLPGATAEFVANVLPDSIHRVDLVDEQGNMVTNRVTLR